MTWICNDLTRKIMEQLILVATEIHFDEFDDKTRFGKQSVMHRKSRPISKVNSMNLKTVVSFYIYGAL